MAEVKLLNERGSEYDYKLVMQHVALDDAPSTPLCGKKLRHVGEGSYSPRDEDKQRCQLCIQAATLKASELVAIARAAEALIERLRADYNSLTTHGPITRATGQLYKAADELMHEAKERALVEVMPKKVVL